LQNASPEEVSVVEQTIERLKNRTDLSDKVKSVTLGFTLLSILGEKLLDQIVQDAQANQEK
jgi:hypothetical protein